MTKKDRLKYSSNNQIKRWKRSRQIAIDRALFVVSVVSKHLELKHLSVLDIGCGYGETTEALYDSNLSIGLEIEKLKLFSNSKQIRHGDYINGDSANLPFKSKSIDLIILQDSIEHIENIGASIDEFRRTLKDGGIIYISTPNKFSIFNALFDPHWGFPLVSLLNRNIISRIVIPLFYRNDIGRKGVAQLLSLKNIYDLFNNDFEIMLNTKYAVSQLFSGNKGLIWSGLHTFVLNIIIFFRVQKIILQITNDKYGFINKYITPTFYLILKTRM